VELLQLRRRERHSKFPGPTGKQVELLELRSHDADDRQSTGIIDPTFELLKRLGLNGECLDPNGAVNMHVELAQAWTAVKEVAGVEKAVPNGQLLECSELASRRQLTVESINAQIDGGGAFEAWNLKGTAGVFLVQVDVELNRRKPVGRA
jgi:hypothetical protein